MSDKGPQFVSEEFESFTKEYGIKHISSAPYDPATIEAADSFLGHEDDH